MILSLDSTAVTASVALIDNEIVLKSEFVNSGLTHSETLLPMIKRVMQGHSFSELDGIAVTVGPGSFTGVRIGIATVKGIAFNYETPCYCVSTLEAIAYNFVDTDCVVCAVMDARRMQFYNALFEIKNGAVNRLCDDRAISIDDLRKELCDKENVVIAGDGAKLCFENLSLDNCELASQDRIYQNAVSIASAIKNKKPITPERLVPVYLRQSQAERELKLKLKR